MPPEPPRSVRSFRALGVDVVVGGATDLELVAVRRLFASRETVFCRSLPGSELNRVNRTRAPSLVVSESLAAALETALRAASATGGLVDPTRAAGADWRAVRVSGRLVTRLPEIALDLGCVVRGLAADEALELLRGDGFVSVGGAVAARGDVVVALPGGGSVRLLGGGLATSGDDGTQVTVAAGSCLAAAVAAEAAFLLDGEGAGWLEARGLPGRIAAADGTATANAAWSALVDPPRAPRGLAPRRAARRRRRAPSVLLLRPAGR